MAAPGPDRVFRAPHQPQQPRVIARMDWTLHGAAPMDLPCSSLLPRSEGSRSDSRGSLGLPLPQIFRLDL